jgi:hypothetical protein
MSDKLRAAAQAALETLDILSKLGNGDVDGDGKGNEIAQDARQNLRAALAEPDEQKPVAHPFEDASVISALYWASILIEKEYPVGHNGADSWLMNYSDKHGENVRRHDHREWEKVHGRWKPKAALAEPAIKESLTTAEPNDYERGFDDGFILRKEKYGKRPWSELHGRWKPKAALEEPEQEYICKCGLRVTQHQCKIDKEF